MPFMEINLRVQDNVHLQILKPEKPGYLVATDIAARGIDVEELSHVINFEIPNIAETYVHRIGRTGRAGLSGVALSFCDAEEKEYLKDIQKLISKPIPVVENHQFPVANAKVNYVKSNSNNLQSKTQGYRTIKKQSTLEQTKPV